MLNLDWLPGGHRPERLRGPLLLTLLSLFVVAGLALASDPVGEQADAGSPDPEAVEEQPDALLPSDSLIPVIFDATEAIEARGHATNIPEALKREGTLSSLEPTHGSFDVLNEDSCASVRCHKVLADVPPTSRHGMIKCVTCHSQRRHHTESCSDCHEVGGRTGAGALLGTSMSSRPGRADAEPGKKNFPPVVPCLTCHLKLTARPSSFPQVDPAEHIKEGQDQTECMDCHRPHDPKPKMGHPMPVPSCRRGRECCLSCHLKADELITEDPVYRPITNSSGVLIPPASLRDMDWGGGAFADWVLNPPTVGPDHGHKTVECISCHGIPPKFSELARRVHNFQHEAVRCGKCHRGSSLIDQKIEEALEQ